MEHNNSITIFIDDEKYPIANFETPVSFEIDTTKLVDGEHILTVVSKNITGGEGIKKIPFTVRNGPAIAVDGLYDNEKVDGIISLMINSYSKGNQQKFNMDGIETPKYTPTWLWILLILFIGWGAFYLIANFSI